MLISNILTTSTKNRVESPLVKLQSVATDARVQYPLKKYCSYYEGSQSEDGDIGSPYLAP